MSSRPMGMNFGNNPWVLRSNKHSMLSSNHLYTVPFTLGKLFGHSLILLQYSSRSPPTVTSAAGGHRDWTPNPASAAPRWCGGWAAASSGSKDPGPAGDTQCSTAAAHVVRIRIQLLAECVIMTRQQHCTVRDVHEWYDSAWILPWRCLNTAMNWIPPWGCLGNSNSDNHGTNGQHKHSEWQTGKARVAAPKPSNHSFTETIKHTSPN